MLILRTPEPRDEKAVMAYRRSFLDCGDSLDGTANLRLAEDYAQWLSAVTDNRSEETVRPGLVPASTLLALEDGGLVGMIDIRHRLNKYLTQYGGHIGYSVAPAHRRRGYATAILAQGLTVCRELGLTRVLVTCNSGNTASARTIQRNSGVLENEVLEDGVSVQRYWIELTGEGE